MTDPGKGTATTGIALALLSAGGFATSGIFASARLSPVGITWGLLDAVSLATYFLISAAGTQEALPPLVMA